ncbi:MAG TPA: hypothetical protein PKE04_14310, partial [Clostridia bacterium]|nr:hypothetical protein [Clostridia bacterium]
MHNLCVKIGGNLKDIIAGGVGQGQAHGQQVLQGFVRPKIAQKAQRLLKLFIHETLHLRDQDLVRLQNFLLDGAGQGGGRDGKRQ